MDIAHGTQFPFRWYVFVALISVRQCEAARDWIYNRDGEENISMVLSQIPYPCVHLAVSIDWVGVSDSTSDSLSSNTEYSVTAQFDGNDPAYQWIVLFLVRLIRSDLRAH